MRGRTFRLAAPLLALLLLVASAAPADAARARKKKSRRASGWRWSGTAGLELIYDDNFLRYSDDYLADFASGLYPYKFKIDQPDCHILAPSLEVMARRRLWSAGDTRLRFKVKRWQYLEESIKTNTAFWYSVRQYLPGRRSVELMYSYAPEQYIRQLSDRPPTLAPSDPLTWREFRYTRNVFTLVWRQPLRRGLNGKLQLNRTLRYYNRPFMENDTWVWNVRGTLYWRVSRAVRLTLDYGYDDASARGYDEVGETRDTSDDSDPSYKRDLYQVEVAWSPRRWRRLFRKVAVRGQYQVYWFTSRKTLEEDPFHVGRRDDVWSVQATLEHTLRRGAVLQVGYRYTRRTADSPWRGDIAEDKDYEQNRWWMGITYRLF